MKQPETERKEKRSFEEQRLAVRVPVDFQASFLVPGRPAQAGRVTEISRSGLRLLCPQQLALGALIKVAFDPVISTATIPSNRVRVGGQVARLIREVGSAYEYGIEVIGDRDMKSALQRTVLQMSMLTFDSCLTENGSLRAPEAQPQGKGSRPFDERRRFMRAAVDFEASYSMTGLPPEPARVTEISRTGLRLLAAARLNAGTFVEITFEPTFKTGTSVNRRVCVRGRIARLVRAAGPPFEYGIQVISDLETKCTLQWAVLQVGLRAASKRKEVAGPRYY